MDRDSGYHEGPRWISAADAAEAAGVAPAAVRAWADAGYIVSQRSQGLAGEQVLVRLDEVLRHVGRPVDPPKPPPDPASSQAELTVDAVPTSSDLAPILKAVPELMEQLTAATDRAARAETKLEFLTEQVASLREQLAQAHPAPAEVAPPPPPPQPEIVLEPPTPPEPEVVPEAFSPPEPEPEREVLPEPPEPPEPEIPEPTVPLPEDVAEVHSEEVPGRGEVERNPVFMREEPTAPVEVVPVQAAPVAEAPQVTEAGGESDAPASSPEELFQDFLRRISQDEAVRKSAPRRARNIDPEERFRAGFEKGIGKHSPPSEKGRSQSERTDSIWGPSEGETPSGNAQMKPSPYKGPAPEKRRWWSRRK